ncbi:hypothetical protein B0T22DRAFT_25268 [Podospora appendiculata]|uniref:Uncharacterized protein n=1 Tax=Podospora appendiculata TaxID=314037 RepID=A0AAE0XGT4_9PEZI|nr:hypothetical protein B0T22DRAFT_25268 [Podospora appendiculata]
MYSGFLLCPPPPRPDAAARPSPVPSILSLLSLFGPRHGARCLATYLANTICTYIWHNKSEPCWRVASRLSPRLARFLLPTFLPPIAVAMLFSPIWARRATALCSLEYYTTVQRRHFPVSVSPGSVPARADPIARFRFRCPALTQHGPFSWVSRVARRHPRHCVKEIPRADPSVLLLSVPCCFSGVLLSLIPSSQERSHRLSSERQPPEYQTPNNK